MAANNNDKDVMNFNDPLDINELAALNDDISAEFIEQLQNQITQNSNLISNKPETDVTTLFEEVDKKGENSDANNSNSAIKKDSALKMDDSIDDNFIKKYKAKIEKQKRAQFEKEEEDAKNAELEKKKKKDSSKQASEQAPKTPEVPAFQSNEIETLTNGNIVEKPITKEQIEYNESLDLLDDNIKYSKYVIYIDPENTEFIESLTVKERKNLINKILKEQDNIVIAQKRLNTIQTYIRHAIVAILTIAIATPVIYFTVNSGLEATINNHRRSQVLFKTLYKDKGKLKQRNY